MWRRYSIKGAGVTVSVRTENEMGNRTEMEK